MQMQPRGGLCGAMCGAHTLRAVCSLVWCGRCGDMALGLASGMSLMRSVRDRLVLCEMVARLMS